MATFLTSNPSTAPLGPFVAGPTSEDIYLGSKFVDQQGNSYRRALAGAVALVPGTLLQSPAEVTNHQNLTPVAAAIGATQVTVALGATATTANQYAEGYLVVSVTPGQGYRYRISSHPAAALSTSVVITLDDPLIVALTTSSRVDLVLNPYSGVIINPTTASGAVAGAAIFAAPIATYCWVQTGGTAVLLAQGTITVGNAVVASTTTAGAIVNGAIDGTTSEQAVVGTAQTGIATTEYGAIKMICDT